MHKRARCSHYLMQKASKMLALLDAQASKMLALLDAKASKMLALLPTPHSPLPTKSKIRNDSHLTTRFEILDS
ncbi:MAG: hypothetical protein KME64_18970 [Scytonematopsis contorta HA4267-MV1]|nr:hypothetical protein [Scytonematopsis contorta HA4267-MV1]